MYQARDTKNGKIYSGANAQELAQKVPSSQHWSYNPKPSTIIRDSIETGLIIPVSGPDWFMALKADERLVGARTEEERRIAAEDAAEDAARAKVRNLADKFSAKYGIDASRFSGAMWQYAVSGITPRIQFTTAEREAEFNELLAQIDAIMKY